MSARRGPAWMLAAVSLGAAVALAPVAGASCHEPAPTPSPSPSEEPALPIPLAPLPLGEDPAAEEPGEQEPEQAPCPEPTAEPEPEETEPPVTSGQFPAIDPFASGMAPLPPPADFPPAPAGEAPVSAPAEGAEGSGTVPDLVASGPLSAATPTPPRPISAGLFTTAIMTLLLLGWSAGRKLLRVPPAA